ncbi:hypothetical protein SK128_016119 [Halocaridina rubra]|uniref:Uncharacterized protein n=1 Tax=Halocaridina rubra TaxID=373956 RepID=A0AAN8WAU5_HALRR
MPRLATALLLLPKAVIEWVCSFIKNELYFRCAEGFKGQRCEEKEVYPTFQEVFPGTATHAGETDMFSQYQVCPKACVTKE